MQIEKNIIAHQAEQRQRGYGTRRSHMAFADSILNSTWNNAFVCFHNSIGRHKGDGKQLCFTLKFV